MPSYQVSSGNFELNIIRDTPEQAALDAFRTLHYRDEFLLGGLTKIIEVGEGDMLDEIYYESTANLVNKTGLSYKDNHADSHTENGKTHEP